jgi:hypothetical protein
MSEAISGVDLNVRLPHIAALMRGYAGKGDERRRPVPQEVRHEGVIEYLLSPVMQAVKDAGRER